MKTIMKHIFKIVCLLISLNSFTQTQKEINTIVKDYDTDKLNQLSIQFNNEYLIKKQKVHDYALAHNLPITVSGKYSLSQMVDVIDNKPIYIATTNIDAAESTRANTLHNNGLLGLNLEGQNMTAYVWDSGKARLTHQEYDGIGGNNRYSVGDGTPTLHFHAAHVTGTIMASGFQPAAKGMAPQCNVIGYDWNNDESEVMTQTNNGMLVSNHSYGALPESIPDQWFGAYTQESKNWDIIMFNAPYYLMVAAAGNTGTDSTSNASPLDSNSSYDKLATKECSKNSMVVANAQDANIDSNGNLVSVTINSTSSQGPTDDYRIKPDITGNGTQLYSTWDDADNSYQSISGTSMASPNVTGTLLLLQQYYNEINSNYMKAATLKGLALHTADDAGTSGPDAIFGWGLLNAKKGAETILQNGENATMDELTLNNSQTYSTSITSDGVNPLIASISWTDPAGTVNNALNSQIPALVNDLDIRITKDGTTYFPYKLTSITTNTTGDNLVDPFERIDIDNASGTYTITVTHKGSLTNGLQNFSLIITGQAYSGVCVADNPTNTAATALLFGQTSSTLSWDNVLGATYEVRYKQDGDTVWTVVTTSNESVIIENLSGIYNAQVRSVCSDEGTSSNWVPFNSPPSFVAKNSSYIFNKNIKVFSDIDNLYINATDNYTIKKVSIYNILGKQLVNNIYNSNQILINKDIIGNEKILIVKILLTDGSVGYKKIILQ